MTHPKPTYLVAGNRAWSRTAFNRVLRRQPGRWEFIGRRSQLTLARVQRLRPRYIFFLHWSWHVPAPILGATECVGFHMTDLPYGRGGTPLQNLILRGHRATKLSAIRMTEAMDGGPVYVKRTLALDGRAQDIYVRASELAARMALEIIRRRPAPRPQQGRAVRFARRRPEQSRIPATRSLRGLYDFLRMLDAQGYPHAFLAWKGYRYSFNNVRRSGRRLGASVTIERAPAGANDQ